MQGHRVRLATAAGLLAVVFFLHWFEPAAWPPLAVDLLHSLHGPGFALVALAAYAFLGGYLSGVTRYVAAAGIALMVGLLSEASQIPGARAAQISDLVINALGIVAALSILAMFDEQIRRRLSGAGHLLLGSFSFVTFSVAILPTLMLAYAFVAQVVTMPEMVNFERRWESATYLQGGTRTPTRYASPRDWPAAGNTVGHVVEDGRWGILLALKPWPDWSDYSRVHFVAGSATEDTYRVGVAIRDRAPEGGAGTNRYYTVIDVGPVARRYSIEFAAIAGVAQDRPFDFSSIDSFIISAASPGDGVRLLLDDISLD